MKSIKILKIHTLLHNYCIFQWLLALTGISPWQNKNFLWKKKQNTSDVWNVNYNCSFLLTGKEGGWMQGNKQWRRRVLCKWVIAWPLPKDTWNTQVQNGWQSKGETRKMFKQILMFFSNSVNTGYYYLTDNWCSWINLLHLFMHTLWP